MANAQLGTVLQHLRGLSDADTLSVSDGQLLERFRARQDEGAFAMLVRRHGPMVLGVCRRVLHNLHDAEDAFQATFLVLTRQAASLRRRESLGCWLYKVAYRVALRAKLAAARRRSHESRAAERPSVSPLADLSVREAQAILDAELHRLPEKYRTPLVLCCLEGLARDEAARLLGLPSSTLKSRLEQGRERLRHRLSRRGLTLPAALALTLLGDGAARAAVPAALAHAVSRAALILAAGQSPSAAVSAQVLALAETTLKPAVTKLKLAIVLLLAAGLAGGAVVLGRQAPREKESGPAANRLALATPERHPAAHADRYGDPLPPAALRRMGTVRFRPGERVEGVAFSPDGKTLAVASMWQLGLWDPATGRELRRVADHTCGPQSVTFSPDGKLLAAACYTQMVVRLWDAATGKELRVFKGHEGFVRQAIFSPDGKTLASAGDDRTIRLWDIATGEQRRCLKGHQFAIFSIAFSPDGRMVASSGIDHAIRLWQVETGVEVHQFQGARREGEFGWISAVAFSPDGKTLASAHDDGAVYLWDIKTTRELRKLLGHGDDVCSVAWSADGKTLVTGSGDGTIRLWEAATGKELRRFSGGERGVGSVILSPDGKTIVSWGGIATPRFWDLATGKERRPFRGHVGEVLRLRAGPDGRTLTSWSRDGSLRFWDLATGADRPVFASSRWYSEDAGIALSADGKLLAIGSCDKTIQLWETASGKKLHALMGHGKPVVAVALAPDGGTLASAGLESTLRFWDVRTGRELWRLSTAEDLLAFSPDGRLLACGGKGRTVRLLETTTGKVVRTINAHPVERRLDVQDSVILFSPDGRLLATARSRDPAIRLWDVTTGEELRRFAQPPMNPSFLGTFTLAFSPDGRVLAGSWAGGDIRLWEVGTGKELRKFEGHRNVVRALAFAPDGRTLFSGSDDSTILAWDVTGLARLGPPASERPATARTARELQALWDDLAGADAPRAYRAIWALAADRQAVSYLKERLHPIKPVEGQRIVHLIADLDGDDFAVRERALHELEKLGDLAEPALRKALGNRPSLELRRRVSQLLERLATSSGELLRSLRAVAVLEHARTQEARQLLEALAGGAPEARLTRETRRALKRLSGARGRLRLGGER